jgi:hypothetical protein
MSAKGKIGRLPYDVRQKLNARMRDGEPDGSILAWLNGLPDVKAALKDARFGGPKKAAPEVSPQNLSEYRAGAYQSWLKDQEHVERIKNLSEFSFQLAEAAGGNVSKSAVSIAAGRMMEALEGATEDDLLKLTQALTGLSGAETAALRAQIDQGRLGVQKDALDLERKKFQRTTSEMFLKWYGNKQAEEIVSGKGNKEAKIEQIRQLMFGELTDDESGNSV